MADISSIIILITFFVVFGIFLLFDLFKRNEKYGYFAYVAAVLPVNMYWSLGYDPLFAYIILFILWDITLLRDTIAVYLKKDKEINEILLYLFLGIIIQLIVMDYQMEIKGPFILEIQKITLVLAEAETYFVVAVRGNAGVAAIGTVYEERMVPPAAAMYEWSRVAVQFEEFYLASNSQ